MEHCSHETIRSWAEADMATSMGNFDLDSLSSSNLFRYIALIIFPLLVLLLYRKVAEDYRAFLALGPGGTPSTPRGYLKILLLKCIVRWDVLKPPRSLSTNLTFQNYFRDPHQLPDRQGTRPTVSGIAPQRQMTQRGTRADIKALQDAMSNLARSNNGVVQTGTSCFEKHNLALFLTASGSSIDIASPSPTGNDFKQESYLALSKQKTLTPHAKLQTYPDVKKRHYKPTCGTPPEIAHTHDIDGSLHLTLHPDDVKVVIEKGWGERHPLAGRGPWVPGGFMMIYAPRGDDDLKAVVEIIRAGCWWVSGVNIASCIE